MRLTEFVVCGKHAASGQPFFWLFSGRKPFYVCPGVHIGDNVVIGAGSVVTRDIPDWCIACGNPCRVLRKITDSDKRKLFRNEEIDDEAWQDIISRGFAD